MYGYTKAMHLSTRPYQLDSFLSKGGLAHIQSFKKAPRLHWSLSLFKEAFLSVKGSELFVVWLSDQGDLNPEALVYFYDFPLNQLVLVRAPDSKMVWKMALEAIQSGSFGWALIHASKGCDVTLLRKIQLATKKNHCKVLTFNLEKVPHWMFKVYLEEGLPPFSPLETPVLL